MAQDFQVSEQTLIGENVWKFALAGNANFTIVSKVTGTRFTYRITAVPNDQPPTAANGWSSRADHSRVSHFVSVLTGPSNETDYAYIGFLSRGEFVHGSKSKIGRTAPSVLAFAWFFRHIESLTEASPLELHHAGTCGKCGRKLTTKDSILRGLGPVCGGVS